MNGRRIVARKFGSLLAMGLAFSFLGGAGTRPAEGQTTMQRISDMGDSMSTDYEATTPEIAYNSNRDEYLVVWSGDDNVGSLADGEYEIFGQRLDGSGVPFGNNDFRISEAGPDGSTFYRAEAPAVAFNPDRDEYLVVWVGDDDDLGPGNDNYEVFGQFLDADGGLIMGALV
ncbi:MAG: hypothetical protein K8J08_00005, partial [Thermoanaerobaculia bacterium]|nr:hypothetical protein [Thermoanaerobaculia bacterium]